MFYKPAPTLLKRMLVTDGVTEQAAKEILRADENVVSYLLGGITVGTAVVGTIGGGLPHAHGIGHITTALSNAEMVMHDFNPRNFDMPLSGVQDGC